ncbi:MAG: PstS family phosphate ABC transporter substrate-binding protein, partial [Proteobacteria bacterium]|nr:PstS family phosphate ABC transporter substrate-binding protein [Pseudomonadota bacterium]
KKMDKKMYNFLILPIIILSGCVLAWPHDTSLAADAGIRIDGSSTVFPISEGIAEEFGAKNPKIRVTVGTSGTGGGFKKFLAGEIDIADASRTIKASESEEAAKKGIKFIELPIAIDGLAIVVHPSNQFLKSISKEQLKRIWEPGSKIHLWSDLDPKFPKEKIALFGPGPDSGTFDYFTEEVVGRARASRTDYTASEDDNVLIKGVSGSKFGLAYFGHGYYLANKSKVLALPVDAGHGPIEPTDENILAEKYPLARTLYIYVSEKSSSVPEVDKFVEFYLSAAKEIAHQTGYLPLSDAKYQDAKARFSKRVVGSASPIKS